MELDFDIYRKRQAIVEHPFGTIKRQWGFDHILTKKFKKRASSEVGLIFSAFNLRRIFNIIDKNLLKEHLRKLSLNFSAFFNAFRSYLTPAILQTHKLVYKTKLSYIEAKRTMNQEFCYC